MVSGASSVPCLTAAVIDAYLPLRSARTSVDYGISAAQQTNRGLATLGGAELCRQADHNVARRRDEDGPRLGEHPCRALSRTRLAPVRQLRHPRPRAVSAALSDTAIDALRRRARTETACISARAAWRPGTSRPHRSLSDHAEGLLRLAFLFDRFGSGRSGFHMYPWRHRPRREAEAAALHRSSPVRDTAPISPVCPRSCSPGD